MEIDIPENQVVLSDFDAWHFPLNNRLISYSDEEDDRLMAMYRTASAKDQKRMRESNWTRIFDIAHVNNDWITIGESIQATFWELRKEQVRKYGSLLRRNRSRDRDMWK